MTNPLPAVEYDAPPLNPIGGGLYAAAQVIEGTGPSRFLGGVRVRPLNCSPGYGTYDTDICAVPDPDALHKGGRLAPLDPFEAIGVWAADECDPSEGDAAIEARARQTLRLKEQILVESAFGERLLAEANAPAGPIATLPDIVSIVGFLEAELSQFGFPGVIHASARAAAAAADHNLIVRSGSALKTPLGHTWAFGGGYVDTLGATFVATGPVTVWRDDVVVRSTLTSTRGVTNELVGVAQRNAVVGFECYVAAVSIA